ncbi:hypothetical protein LWI28_025229 [Acer negundo]|uniref:Uncharacterized protein n=1 Tax=Acer negundo TaxID=4023 RepID=A0AAD5NT20_ACENE|nr:hypothetical protein LWI28_025229 [Acer negundo]KAK4852841.1 hypothetical protein QYF36_027468 [Acer negundo]
MASSSLLLILAFFIALSCPNSSINLVLAARQLEWPFMFGVNMITPLPKPKLPPIILTPPPHLAAEPPLLPPEMAMAPVLALPPNPPIASLSPAVMGPVLPPTSSLHGLRMSPSGSPHKSLSLP